MTRTSVPKTRREKIASVAKVVTAIVVTVMLFLSIGVIYVKDSRKDASYCASCHDDYYDTWASDGESYSLAHAHAEMSVTCQTCHHRTIGESVSELVAHGTGDYSFPLAETTMEDDLCLSCHGSAARVKSLTNITITRAEIDYHSEYHGRFPCGTCHNMHRDSAQVCALCHPVDEEPGWVIPPEDFWNAVSGDSVE